MRALVLAAGVGSRLKPYTDTIPKPMVPIGGRPILSYNLAILAAAGFDDVVINLHAFPEVVREYVGDGSHWGIHVTYSEEPQLLGTAGALVPVIDLFRQGTFAIVFGDNLTELNLAEMLAFHRATGGVATIAVWERDDVSQSGVAELSDDARVLQFIEKPQPGKTDSHWVNAGVIIAEPALLTLVPRDHPSDLGRDVLPAMIAHGMEVAAYRCYGGHWWFDRADDYRAALDDRELRRFTDSYAD
jgi:NDP-sugar pyrophosphorylase family protein